jgi:hypothetical protein
MSYEAYYRIVPVGIMVLIIVMQIRPVMSVLYQVTNKSMLIIANWFGLDFVV